MKLDEEGEKEVEFQRVYDSGDEDAMWLEVYV